MIQYTLVCPDCHSGWYSEEQDGKCPYCGKPAILRARTHVIDVSNQAPDQESR